MQTEKKHPSYHEKPEQQAVSQSWRHAAPDMISL